MLQPPRVPITAFLALALALTAASTGVGPVFRPQQGPAQTVRVRGAHHRAFPGALLSARRAPPPKRPRGWRSAGTRACRRSSKHDLDGSAAAHSLRVQSGLPPDQRRVRHRRRHRRRDGRTAPANRDAGLRDARRNGPRARARAGARVPVRHREREPRGRRRRAAASRLSRCGSSRAWPSICRSVMSIRTRRCGFATRRGTKDKLPSIDELDNPNNFPYRWGQAFWAYVAGRWGDDIVRTNARRGDPDRASPSPGDRTRARRQARGAVDTVARGHLDAVRADARSRDARQQDGPRRWRATRSGRSWRSRPRSVPTAATSSISRSGTCSPSTCTWRTSKRDASFGRLTNTAIDPHFNSIQFLASAGAWHPRGHQFVFGAIRDGYPVLAIVDTDTGRRIREIPFPDLGEILNPTWSPDARWIAFSASTGRPLRSVCLRPDDEHAAAAHQ